MATPDPLTWVELGLALLGAGAGLFVLREQKRDKMDSEMDDLYEKLKEKQLDPLVEEILGEKHARDDPHKVMTLPGVAERLRKHSELVEQYIDANELKQVIKSSLDYACIASLIVGAIEVGYGIAVGSVPSYSTFFSSNIAALSLGSFFLVMFLVRYGMDANKYGEAVRKVRRRCA